MAFFTSRIKTTVFLTAVLGMLTTLGARSGWADDCGSNQRDPLPSCSRFVSSGAEGGVEIYNLCSKTITVKLDVSGASDKRIDVKPGYGAHANVGTTKKLVGYAYDVINRPTEASCCPRYSACSFPNDAPVPDPSAGRDPYSYGKAAEADPRFKGFQN